MKKNTMRLLTTVTNLLKANIYRVEYKHNRIVLNNTLPISASKKEVEQFKLAEDKVLWLLLLLAKNTELTPVSVEWWYRNKYSQPENTQTIIQP